MMRTLVFSFFFLVLCALARCDYLYAPSPSRSLLVSPSIPRKYGNRFQSSMHVLPSHYNSCGSRNRLARSSCVVLLASTSKNAPTRKRNKTSSSSKTATKSEEMETSDDMVSANRRPDVSYADLSPFGKVVAGTVEITVSTLLEYVSGFMGGYFLGTVTDIPRFLFRTATEAGADPTKKIAAGWQKEISQRYIRMHSKSFKWAKSWGGISAAFGGFQVATKVLRSGKEDEWNTIISSAAAGAFFARKEGPQGILRGAILYGGLMYLLSGGRLSGTKEPFQYNDEPIDF